MTYTVAEWSDVSVPTAGRIDSTNAGKLIATATPPSATDFLKPDTAALELIPRPWGAGDQSADQTAATYLPAQKGAANRQGLALAADPVVKYT